MKLLVALPVYAAGFYLVGLGLLALLSPDRANRFLEGFASSARAHYTELIVRIVIGAALLMSARDMMFPGIFFSFAWVLIGTTIALAAVPWRFHERFARRSVPIATRYMPLVGAGSLAGGAFLLLALLWRPGA